MEAAELNRLTNLYYSFKQRGDREFSKNEFWDLRLADWT